MAGSDDSDWAGGDEVLGRAEALLGRHRLSRPRPPAPESVPTLTETIHAPAAAAAAASIPTLTDVVEDPASPAGPPV